MSKKKGVPLQVYKKRYVWKECSMFEFLEEMKTEIPVQTITNNDVENFPTNDLYPYYEYVLLTGGKVACVVSTALCLESDEYEAGQPQFFIGVPFDENKRKELLAKLSDYEKALLGVTP